MMVFFKLASGRWAFMMVMCLTLAPTWSVFGESISYTSGAESIFGDSTIYGDTLLFSPTAFSSSCSGAAGVNMADGLLRVWITSPTGIENVSVQEGGAWFFFGPGTAATQAYVGAHAAELVITQVDGLPVVGDPLIIVPGTMDFSPSSSAVGSRTFNATEPVDPAGWQGTMLFDDLGATLAGTPYQGELVTGAMLVFDDILATASEVGTVAYIDKKWISITTSPQPDSVPEPGTLVLLAAASALGLIYRLRKRSKTN
jgi:hypothetical protein